MKPLLLLIDDDKNFVADFTMLLKNDYSCLGAYDRSQGLQTIRQKNPDVILLDLIFDGALSGLDILADIQKIDNSIPVIIITDYASIDTAVQATKLGAFNYVSKTADLNSFKLIIEKSLQQRLLHFQKRDLQEESHRPYYDLVGNSLVINELKQRILLFASTENAVLITGESGVGKELVARQIHLRSGRKNKHFVAINCTAIPKELFESELFGHEKGAFTGAHARKIGKIEIAADGTIFFDEIAELEVTSQVKLLRVLQEREYERVGGVVPIRTAARVIAATNRNLEDSIQNGMFREELYYRLNVLPIHVTPLREHKDDIMPLVHHFLEQASHELKTPKKEVDSSVLEVFNQYEWPGNIRELQNSLVRAAILAQDSPTISLKHVNFLFPQERRADKVPSAAPKTWKEMEKLKKQAALAAGVEIERQFIRTVLKDFDGSISKCARHLGISRTHLHRIIRRCEIDA